MANIDRKRFIWILIAIFFFFANLVVMTVVALNAFLSPRTPPTQQVTPETSPATAPASDKP